MNNFGPSFSFNHKKEELKNFIPILDRWIEMNNEYFDVTEGDASCWYTESSCTSFLSGAIWSASNITQYVALKEFQHIKRAKDKKNKKDGRADLYICGGNASYICEAKKRSFSISNNSDFKKRFKKVLKSAKKDVRDSWTTDEFDYGLAITFLDLSGKNDSSLNSSCGAFLEQFKSSKKIHAGAVWFMNDPYEYKDRYLSIGQALALELVPFKGCGFAD